MDYGFLDPHGTDGDKIAEVIAVKDEIELKGRQMHAAYEALRDYRAMDADYAKYFMVSPTGDLSMGVQASARHGLTITNPNVKDENLPEAAKEARERAVAVAVAAAAAVQPLPHSKGVSLAK